MNKLTQSQIDELAKDSDEEQPQYQQQFQQNMVQEEYPMDEEMQEDMNEQIGEEKPEEQYKIDDQPEVESEIASENMDEVMSQQIANSDFQFKKDQDLSEAQSEFIQSSRLNDGLKIKSNIKSQASNEIIKPKPNQNKKPKTADPKQKPKAIKKPLPKPAATKQAEKGKVEDQNKKEKLSESEIARRLKEIQEGKRQMQRKKEERAKKDEQARRKEYEQAKQKQQQRKQKNKRIFEQQQKAKKKTLSAAPSVKSEEEVKIPEKRSDYKYMEQKKQRMMNEKQIQKQIQQQNIQKLKRLNENQPRQLKGQAKKQAILDERNYQLQRQKKEKQKQDRDEDVLIIKQIKQQIIECKRFNLEKNQQINRAEKNIEILTKKVKQKQKLLYDVDSKAGASKQEPVYQDLSELSPVEKFVNAFPQTKTVDEIFSMIDFNGDGVLSSAQIHQKLSEFGLAKQIIDKVQEVLDENNDGTVSRQQFVFLIQLQIKRQKDYRQILGDITIANPLDLQARIVDMQAKLKYINKQLELHRSSNEDETYQNKIDKLQRKAGKIQAKMRRDVTDLAQEGKGDMPIVNTMAHLTNEYIRLRNDKAIRLNFLQKLRKRVKQNLAEKNKLLTSRVEEGLRLEQELYKIKNDIQERQLRFLSMKKIEENKRGYVERQTQQRKQMEEAYKRTKQYEVFISDPSKKAQNNALAEEMKFLAAVLMIQRNYRRKKARAEVERLKQESK